MPTFDLEKSVVKRFVRTGSGCRLDQCGHEKSCGDHGQAKQKEVDKVEREIILEEERELEEQTSADQNEHGDRVHDDVSHEPGEPERKVLNLVITRATL